MASEYKIHHEVFPHHGSAMRVYRAQVLLRADFHVAEIMLTSANSPGEFEDHIWRKLDAQIRAAAKELATDEGMAPRSGA